MKRGLYLSLLLAAVFMSGLGSLNLVSSEEVLLENFFKSTYSLSQDFNGPPWRAQTVKVGISRPDLNYEQRISSIILYGQFTPGQVSVEIRNYDLNEEKILDSVVSGCSSTSVTRIGSSYRYNVSFSDNCILNKDVTYALVVHSSSIWDIWHSQPSKDEDDECPGIYPLSYPYGGPYQSYQGSIWSPIGHLSIYDHSTGETCTWLPLDLYFAFYGEIVPPTITLTNPVSGQTYTSKNINVVGSSNKEVYLWGVNYSGSYSDNALYFQSGTSFNRPFSFYNGNYNLELFAWEFEEGPVGKDSASFSVAQRPTITINAPTNNQIFSSTNNVSVTASASNVNTPQNRITQWRIEIDGATQPAVNYSYTGTNLNLNRVLTNLPKDTYTLRVYGRDDSGVWGVSAVRSFSVTYDPPRLEILYPEDGGYYQAPFNYNLLLDTSESSFTYNVIGGSVTYSGTFSCSNPSACTYAIHNSLSPGTYTLTVSSGMSLSDSVTFTVGPAPCVPSRTCEYYSNLGQCGSGLSDGCEDVLTCGCPTGQTCVNGACVAVVNPIYRWENSAGNEISNAQVGNTVFLAIVNSGLAAGSSAVFEIYDEDLLLDDHIRDVDGVVDSNRVLRADWTITQSDYDAAGSSDNHEEYYFKVNSVSSSMTSGYLAIQESSGEPGVDIVFPECGENFTLGDTVGIELNTINLDSGTLKVYKVGENNVELQLETFGLVEGNNNFNYLFNSSLGGGNYRLVAEVTKSGERTRRTSNIMIVDAGSNTMDYYAAACVDEPEDLSNLPSGIVRFNASSSRGLLFIPSQGSFPLQMIPLTKENLLFRWKFSDEGGYRTNPYLNGMTEERAYLFYKIFVPVNDNGAELEVEINPYLFQ